MKYFISLIIVFAFISCREESGRNTRDDDTENSYDTSLTPQERFSTAILIDFLEDSNDEDLASYLETEIYRRGANFKGASIMEISPAVWFVMFQKDTVSQNFILQKFVDIKTNDNYFQLNETKLTLTDIITKRKGKTSQTEPD
jgi:hypothetical protein